ncbi:hypothetical protein C8F04DRAFT_1253203 [Mycena alexandri]|uniref:SAM domain-containing protein n=1 Tax=Mycena alexandri TaxID=1745969 RepID=A0AAD6TB41_9AGAR|nr:hypothetical protein C8F04DRAFT_1253203 [Mycena alexandri]
MSPETARLFNHSNIKSGTGGIGGRGELQDGINGSLYAGKMGEAVNDMPLKDFCAQYKVGKDVLERLGQLGFTTAGALLGVEDDQLADMGFNLGHISELKRALKLFADNTGTGK